ncbi:MAG: precorrin-8X methylmutase [Anaerovoracaceae bacterium]
MTENNKVQLQQVLPKDIEKRSFELISEEMGLVDLDPLEAPVIKRAIHTSADFEYLENLVFSPDAVKKGMEIIKNGATIITDTKMAYSGINKKTAEKFGCKVCCFMADDDVRETAVKNGTTRAVASMEKAAQLDGPLIFVIGNAPTALVTLYELIKSGKLAPELIIGVPVGFVNVIESKELILQLDTPHIIAKGRKGGSNIAAAIFNGILYQC